MNVGLRVAGYVRVSTDEQGQSGLGLAAQRTTITEACKQRGWRLVEVFEDRAASGKSLAGRKGVQKALKAVEWGAADAIVVAKLDRLSRSLLDFAALMERARKEGWALVALDLGVDMTSPSGQLIANVMASFAEFERRLIGQRTKEALAVKKSNGIRLGRQSTLPPTVRAQIVRLRASGMSMASIADCLNSKEIATGQGGARWYASSVRAVLISEKRDR